MGMVGERQAARRIKQDSLKSCPVHHSDFYPGLEAFQQRQINNIFREAGNALKHA